jgi:hypothetical protein
MTLKKNSKQTEVLKNAGILGIWLEGEYDVEYFKSWYGFLISILQICQFSLFIITG